MAAFRLLFLLLGEFEFVDRICEGGIKCLDKAGCKPYLDALEAYKQMPKGFCRKKVMLAELKHSVCNKAEGGVCCNPSCRLGQVCLPHNECPSFLADLAEKNELDRGSYERTSLVKSLKKRVCDKGSRTVCCEPADSADATPDNNISVPQL